jgi:hypothetical protein
MDLMQKPRIKRAAALFVILFSAFLTINCALWELLTADMDADREATRAVIQQQTNDAQMTVDALKTMEKEYERTAQVRILYDGLTADAIYRLTKTAKTHAASTENAALMWTWSAEQYATDMALTPSSTPSRPIILDIEFPATIPGDGTTYNGELSFVDENGDINRLTIEVISATEFGSADYDPTEYIIDGNNYRGTTQLYIWCKGAQSVRLRATLYDRAGLKSNSMDFSFTCQ